MSEVSKAQQFADDVMHLAVLTGDADEWVRETSPWSPVNQVVGMACVRLEELKDTEGMTEHETILAQTASGAIHAVCVVLEELQDAWYQRHNPEPGDTNHDS